MYQLARFFLFFLIINLIPRLGCSVEIAFTDTLFINDVKSVDVYTSIKYIETDKDVVVEQVQQLFRESSGVSRMYPKNTLNAGVINKIFWLRILIKNDLSQAANYYFQLHQPWLRSVQLYRKTERGFSLDGVSGIKIPFEERSYNYYDHLFVLNLPANTLQEYLIRVDNLGGSVNLKPTLLDESSFKAQENREYLFFGLLTGIMIFSLVVNLFLYLSLKDKVHLLYFFYVLSMLYWIYCNMNFDFQFFYPNQLLLAEISEYIAGSFGIISMSFLIISFLDINRNNSKVYQVIKYAPIYFILLIILSFIAYWDEDTMHFRQLYIYLFVVSVVAAAMIFYFAAIEKIFQKVSVAWFYFIGGGYLAFSIIKYCIFLLGGGMNSSVQNVPNDLQIGLVVEAVIIFLGIIYRYNLYKNDREKLLLSLNRQQNDTMQQVVAAQEEERKRIAQDLHDDLGATLGTLILHISSFPVDDKRNKDYEKIVNISKKAIQDLRDISHDLIPKNFIEEGIFHVLSNKIEMLNDVSIIKFELILEGDDKTLSEIFSITIYRIINELISNVLKHSGAHYATIQLILDDNSIMVIFEDDGKGFINKDLSQNGIGLANITSRVSFLDGTIYIDEGEKGTSIIIEIPILT